MPYLNLDLNYTDHPKTKRLKALIGSHADVFPIRLWLYCAKYHMRDGSLKDYSISEIENLCDWSGKNGELVESLFKVGFLKKKGDFFVVSDWKEYQGHLEIFKKRAIQANAIRWKRYRKESLKHPTRTPKTQNKESSLPYHTIPNHTKEKKPPISPFSKNPEDPPTPHWQDLIDHVDQTWKSKRRSQITWKREGKFLRELAALCRTYQAWGVMALWDLYLESRDGWIRDRGFAPKHFGDQTYKLVDDSLFKVKSSKYQQALEGDVKNPLGEIDMTKVVKTL